MNVLLAILLIFFYIGINAQTWVNVTSQYIQNPSFEDYTACPQSNSAYPNAMWIDSVVGWYAPTQGTSDYFNACSTGTNNAPNTSIGGFQLPFQGVAFCGFYAYGNDWTMNNRMWSEYIQTKLLQPLKANTTYQFTMRINRGNDYYLAVQNIGAHFSENANKDFSNTKPYNLTPTVLNATGFLTDTLGWTLVSGEFTATGNENYLTIGWFGDTLTNDSIFFIPPDGYDSIIGEPIFDPWTYYFVDGLTLSEQTFDIENFNFNVITPNADGSNDFLDFSVYDLQELSFTVFNRWGNQIFKSNDAQLKWDGKNNQNKKLSEGTYFYIIHAITSTGKQISKHNSITILY